jgi:paraquat-inducible protein B
MPEYKGKRNTVTFPIELYDEIAKMAKSETRTLSQMTKPNFKAMDRQELRTYVLQHRDDEEAFQVLMEKLQELPGIEIDSMEQLSQIIESKRDLADIKDVHLKLEEAEVTSNIPLEELKRELGL